MTDPKLTIPKFGSFRPNSALPLPKRTEQGRQQSRHDSMRGRNSETRAHNSDLDHWNSSTSQHRSESKGRTRTQDIVRHNSNNENHELFTVDVKGDVKNLIFGAISHYAVPSYRRLGAGCILGAPTNMKIDRNHGDEGLILRQGHERSTTREKYVFSKVEKQKPRLLRIRHRIDVEPFSSHELDFISLQTGKKYRRGGVALDSESEPEGSHCQSIYDKASDNDLPLDEDLRYATDSESCGSDTGRTVKQDMLKRQKSIDLSRKVEQSPGDIDAWFALIDYQDTLVRATDDRRRLTDDEIRSTADIKISMYEKALERASSLSDRERLLLGLMNEGSKIWEISYQAERWEEISKGYIDSLLLWTRYMSFRQTSFPTFRYEEVREIYLRRINLLLVTLTSMEPDRAIPLYEQLVYVILRFTIYVRDSGYVELGVAIWQTLLEYNFFSPLVFSHEAEKKASFKEFWESEVPRVGETGAIGWSRSVINQDSLVGPTPDLLTAKDENSSSWNVNNIFSSWAQAERRKSQYSKFPARTTDEVAEDDPFQVILAADVDEFLVSLPAEPTSLRRSLIDGFLLFCHLPPIWNHLSSSELWACAMFKGQGLIKTDFGLVGKGRLSSKDDFGDSNKSTVSSIFQNAASRFKGSSESMFSRSWFQSLRIWHSDHPLGEGSLSYKWVRATLQQLTQSCFNEDLGEYYLGFEWKNEPNTIKKVSRSLLKQNPASLRLYNSYGMIEWALGNRDSANAVFSAALLGKSMLEAQDHANTIFLWKSWVWLSLDDGDTETALYRLISIAGNPGATPRPSPAVLLKARQHLQANRDYNLSSSNIYHAIAYAECLALLEYLGSKSNYEAQTRLFLQAAARLLHHHGRTGSFRPAFHRQQLHDFLMLFPRNTVFLSLYYYNESRLSIDNRVRYVLQSSLFIPQNDSPTSRIFAIKYEISFGTIHSVRSSFENALASSVSTLAVGLWRFYISYCIHTPEFHPHAKDVWYRAIRACPWAKELYILGFEVCEGFVDFDDLKATWQVMGEKGLRVLIDLEDRFDELRELERPGNGKEMKKLNIN